MVDLRDTALVDMADEARRPTRWWLAWPVGVLIALVGLLIGDLVGTAVLGNPPEGDPKAQYVEVFMFGTTALLLFLWVRLEGGPAVLVPGVPRQSPTRPLPGWAHARGRAHGRGCADSHRPRRPPERDVGAQPERHQCAAPADPAAWSCSCCRARPRRLVFRGYMLPMGLRQLPGWAAVVGTSIIFAVMHIGAGVVGTLNIVLYAVFACLVVIQQGSLWLICGFHAGWNYFQGNVFGVPVSGNTEPTSLFSFGPTAGLERAHLGRHVRDRGQPDGHGDDGRCHRGRLDRIAADPSGHPRPRRGNDHHHRRRLTPA